MYPATPAHYLHAKSVTCICCLSTGMRGEQTSKEVIIHTSYYMLCQMTCYFLVINCLSLFLQYYFKTGTCKFGSNCKYHHPKQDGSVQSVILNNGGFPLRPVWKFLWLCFLDYFKLFAKNNLHEWIAGWERMLLLYEDWAMQVWFYM